MNTDQDMIAPLAETFDYASLPTIPVTTSAEMFSGYNPFAFEDQFTASAGSFDSEDMYYA